MWSATSVDVTGPLTVGSGMACSSHAFGQPAWSEVTRSNTTTRGSGSSGKKAISRVKCEIFAAAPSLGAWKPVE